MKLTPSQRCNRKLFLSGIVLQLLLVIVFLAAGVLKLTDFKIIETDIFRGTQAQQNALREFEIFIKDWCRVRQARTDVERLVYLFKLSQLKVRSAHSFCSLQSLLLQTRPLELYLNKILALAGVNSCQAVYGK